MESFAYLPVAVVKEKCTKTIHMIWESREKTDKEYIEKFMRRWNFFLGLPLINLIVAQYTFESAKEHLIWARHVEFPSNYHWREYDCASSLFELCEAVSEKVTGTDTIAVSRSDWECINAI